MIFSKKAEAHHIGMGGIVGVLIGFAIAYLMAKGIIPDFLNLFAMCLG